jgi:hypothetical protein
MRARRSMRAVLLATTALACGGADAGAGTGGDAGAGDGGGGASPVLTVDVRGPGTVEVTATRDTPESSATSTMGCQDSCAVSMGAGAAVVLTPRPQAGARFAGWSGPCDGMGACRLVLDGDVAVGATFSSR